MKKDYTLGIKKGHKIMKQAIKQLLKEIKSIDQECIDLNKWNFENRNGFIKTLEWRLEFALKEGE